MIDFPTTMDDAPLVLLDFFRTRKLTPHVVRALYQMSGFALNRFYPDSTAPTESLAASATSTPPMSQADVESTLQQLASVPTTERQTAGAQHSIFSGINWQALAVTLLIELAKILSGGI